MELTVNGQSRQAPADSTVVELLGRLGIEADAGGVAVAVNGKVVPKTAWEDRRLSQGDAVEIIHAVQGG